MNNTITIEKANIKIENGKVVIDMDADSLRKALGISMVALGTLKPGAEFKLGDEVFIVLEQDGNNTAVIAKEFPFSMKFGDNNDWRESEIRDELNEEYYYKIANLVGERNIIPMTRDLSAMDGSGSYGTCEDKISLLTFDEYRKYHEILGVDDVEYPDWWYLITAATMRKDYARGVCYVLSSGVPLWDGCGFSRGVRPFLTLESSVLVLENN